jgi:hypothetical protein
MVRIFLAAATLGLLLVAGGVLYLGAFPPTPLMHHVEHTVPNTQFTSAQ